MKKNPGLVFRTCLIIFDVSAILASCLFAYFFRTHIDSRPYYFAPSLSKFIISILPLVPAWIAILVSLSLYKKKVFLAKNHLSEIFRLAIASIVGIMSLITYDFFTPSTLFPVRPVAIYAAIFCFISLSAVRFILRFVRYLFTKGHRGSIRVIIVGNSQNTERLASRIVDFPEEGYELAGIVAHNNFIPKHLKDYKQPSLKIALENVQADAIFQTDDHQTEYNYQQSIDHHLFYYYVPSEATLSSHFGELELIGTTPAMLIKVTPLIGDARIAKRLVDILLGSIFLILAALPMLLIWIIIKLSDFRSPATYSEKRLSQYQQPFRIYKFRTMKSKYCGLSPEAAFTKMKKPEIIKEYRKNGDFIPNDPRITRIGKFLRATSLDELPQLFNVVKGDISLVGPRALVARELSNYGDRSLLLSVKAGLTGLAQVSGRRDISFAERRALDLYYIQNWSIFLDLQILVRTFGVVFLRKGAK